MIVICKIERCAGKPKSPLILNIGPLSSSAGLVHTSLCAGVSAGEVHEEGVLRPAEGCRDGGTLLATLRLYLC